MIDSLTKLTMAKYIDLMCGDLDVLKESGREVLNMEKAAVMARDLISDFAKMSDPKAVASYLAEHEDNTKDKALCLLFKVCLNLIALKGHDDVRRILSEYGVNAEGMSDKSLEREVKSQLRTVESRIERTKAEKGDVKEFGELPTPENIRRNFDRQAASLMTYFKFQIDFNVIKASQFAYMISQAEREVKARMAALKK